MKVITFPSDDFNVEELNRLNDTELYRICETHRYECFLYDSVKDFQEAFNNGYISDEWFIFFIN